MQATPLFYPPLRNPNLKSLSFYHSSTFSTKPPLPHLGFSRFLSKDHRFIKNCIVSSQELSHFDTEITAQNGGFSLCDRVNEREDDKMLGTQSLWSQIKEIMMFTGPATGLWICGPLMSLIDTAVIGQGSSIELAALGPGTVLCDYMSYVFMFLSVATSNMVATSLAREDKKEVQHQISVLLFVGLAGGLLMLFFTKFFGSWALTAFTGPNNVHIVPAANTYVQIRGLAWPAVIVGWVAQSASLGMKDSWGPLKALGIASAINGVGDIVLCSFLGYGIAGAAWATMVSQVVAGYMMIDSLNKKGFNAFAISVPSLDDLRTIFAISAPVFITMMAKVAFYALIIYFATNMGTYTVAAHQARMLLKSLIIIGAILGLILGIVGTAVPWLFPNIFTPDQKVIDEMHKVLAPYFISLAVTPAALALEGTLLAGHDLKFVSLMMSGCFTLGAIVLLVRIYLRTLSSTYSEILMFLSVSAGEQWWIWFAGLLVCPRRISMGKNQYTRLSMMDMARFFLCLQRLLSPTGMLYSEESNDYKPEMLKVA
ncbi:hypothetical protein GOBAR_AA04563 [Gossypium barbadense]|uniref:Protein DETOXIFICATION n=1 Tax=Gossypium barbadense TaxID=3634 RepID=A0A2P5YK36_GOSBA|nr:hypothetical protein GOBAR_AA04563 [Gossypium barbadense]